MNMKRSFSNFPLGNKKKWLILLMLILVVPFVSGAIWDSITSFRGKVDWSTIGWTAAGVVFTGFLIFLRLKFKRAGRLKQAKDRHGWLEKQKSGLTRLQKWEIDLDGHQRAINRRLVKAEKNLTRIAVWEKKLRLWAETLGSKISKVRKRVKKIKKYSDESLVFFKRVLAFLYTNLRYVENFKTLLNDMEGLLNGVIELEQDERADAKEMVGVEKKELRRAKRLWRAAKRGVGRGVGRAKEVVQLIRQRRFNEWRIKGKTRRAEKLAKKIRNEVHMQRDVIGDIEGVMGNIARVTRDQDYGNYILVGFSSDARTLERDLKVFETHIYGDIKRLTRLQKGVKKLEGRVRRKERRGAAVEKAAEGAGQLGMEV